MSDTAAELAAIVLYTAAATVCIPAGGVLARFERIRPRWLENEFSHLVIAVGGGTLGLALAMLAKAALGD